MRGALAFLAFVNRWSLARWMLARKVKGSRRVLDVATGSADIPQYLVRRGAVGQGVGLDRGATALAIAAERSPDVPLVRADCRQMPFADKAFDAAVCHLFFHHLDEDDVGRVLREMDRVSSRVVVLDLARSRWLLWVVGILTWLSGNRIARFDGPVSVRRSYTVAEVKGLAARSGVEARVDGRLPGRWCLQSERRENGG